MSTLTKGTKVTRHTTLAMLSMKPTSPISELKSTKLHEILISLFHNIFSRCLKTLLVEVSMCRGNVCLWLQMSLTLNNKKVTNQMYPFNAWCVREINYLRNSTLRSYLRLRHLPWVFASQCSWNHVFGNGSLLSNLRPYQSLKICVENALYTSWFTARNNNQHELCEITGNGSRWSLRINHIHRSFLNTRRSFELYTRCLFGIEHGTPFSGGLYTHRAAVNNCYRIRIAKQALAINKLCCESSDLNGVKIYIWHIQINMKM